MGTLERTGELMVDAYSEKIFQFEPRTFSTEGLLFLEK